jgi:hypothetical protein
MAPGRQKVVVAAALYDVRNCSAVDLDIENYVPSKVRSPQNNQAPTWLRSGCSDGDYANKNKDQEEFGDGGVT